MAQAILINCEQRKNGIELTFKDLGGNEFSGIYNLGNLELNELKKLIGNQISFSDREDGFHVHKAWDGEKPTYCDDPFHGFDRADR